VGQDPSEIREEIEETRARMGDTVEAIGYKTDVKARAKESVQQKVGGVRERITGAKDSVTDKTPSTGDVKQGARQAAGVAQQNPLGLGIAAIAGGFLAGMLIPSTRVEDEKFGQTATEVKDRVKDTAQEAMEHGKQVAQEVAQNAAETAKEQGQQHADELKSSVKS
jgi:gas vesicle protein